MSQSRLLPSAFAHALPEPGPATASASDVLLTVAGNSAPVLQHVGCGGVVQEMCFSSSFRNRARPAFLVSTYNCARHAMAVGCMRKETTPHRARVPAFHLLMTSVMKLTNYNKAPCDIQMCTCMTSTTTQTNIWINTCTGAGSCIPQDRP